jgi:hypothetical protein
MAFTCGPHHLVHGLHLLTAGGPAGPLDLAVVLVGFPAGVTWFLLRVEAFRGGQGDRFLAGNPRWVLALPVLASAYVTALVVIIAETPAHGWVHLGSVAANVVLVVLYSMVGWYLARTQLANRRPLGGWSLSGLSLTIVFPTCAVMHAIYAYYVLSGRYGPAPQTDVIDWLAIPAAVYFLWVVRLLYRGTFMDWNRWPLVVSGSAR